MMDSDIEVIDLTEESCYNHLKPSSSTSMKPWVFSSDSDSSLSEYCLKSKTETQNDLGESQVIHSKPIGGKRKCRSKDEIAQNKINKELKRIQREISVSANTKCEQYLYCYIDNRVPFLHEDIRNELQNRFAERKINEQLVFEQSQDENMNAIWKRKVVSAHFEDGLPKKSTDMVREKAFLCVIGSNSFSEICKSHSLAEFIKKQLQKTSINDSKLTIVVFGRPKIPEAQLNSEILDVYEKFYAQIRVVENAADFSYLIVQFHRAIAKMPKKENKNNGEDPASLIHPSKGISEGPDIVQDWWRRMLEHVPRITVEQQRAIVNSHPNPFVLMDSMVADEPGDAIYKLAKIQTEGGRRIGPIIAQRVFKLLTNLNGNDVIDKGS